MKPILEKLALTLEWEGGYVNHPNDPGGATKYGITERFARAKGFTGRIRDLPLNVAVNWYWDTIYLRYKFDEIKSPVSPYLFDMAVNHGQWTRIAQRAVLPWASHVVVDGVWGPQTHTAIEWAARVVPEDFLRSLMVERCRYGREITARNRSLEVFLLGWLRRWLDERWSH